MTDDAKLKEYIQLAIDLKLAGYKYLEALSFEEIKKHVNGIGPECFPASIRKVIDKLNPTLIIASIIHDIRYSFGDGSKGDFYQANADLEINGRILARHKYRFYDIRRYYVYFKAHEFKVLCDDFGWCAYVSAIESRYCNC